MGQNYKDFLTQQLNNADIKAEYDALEPEFAMIQAMIDAGKASEFTRQQMLENQYMFFEMYFST